MRSSAERRVLAAVGDEWFTYHDNLMRLADHLVAMGTLTDVPDVLSFFEKPWRYTPEWEALVADD